MKSITLRISTLLIVTLVIITACGSPKKSPVSSGDDGAEVSTLSDVEVPSQFNWRTYDNVEITITSTSAGILHIESDKGPVFYSAYLNGTDEHTFKLPLPAYEKQLKARFAGQVATIEVNSDRITHNFN